MKRLIAFTLTLAMILGSFGTVYAAGTADKIPSGLYSMASMGEYDFFRNYVDGYEMYVDKGMTVDMSYSEVCTVLSSSTKRIEIYKQSMAGTSHAGYNNYSNKFITTPGHYQLYNGTKEINGREVHILSWRRSRLGRVQNDMNYYVCADIPAGSYVYTIFIKSAVAINNYEQYSYILESFTPNVHARKSGYTAKTQTVPIEERGWNEETEEFYCTYFGEYADLSWGIFEPETALFDYSQLDYYEKYFDYEFPVILNYSEFTRSKHKNLKQRLDTAWEYGKVLELTLQTIPTSGENMMYGILAGEYDDFLLDYATVIAEFGHPVLFRPFNEMNGDWCPYSAYNTGKDTLIFKEVYKYIYGIFEEKGATANTIWIWNPNGGSFPDFKWNHALMYYPGDEYVDIVGLTAYNTGTYYASSGEKWKTFAELYNGLYADYCKWFSQPLMITEFASASMGGDKAAWITAMFKQIDKYDRIKMAVWWDGCDWDADGNIARSYFLDETAATLKAFKKGLKWWHNLYA